jgi:hypothetical protein
MNIRAIVLVLLSTALAHAQGGGQAAEKPAQELNVPVSISRIRTARTRVEAYVVAVKSKFKPADAEYSKLKNEYVEAYSKYDGWTSALKVAIASGASKQLQKDAGYQTIAKEASAAAEKFVNDAIALTQTNRGGPIDVLSSFAGLGIDIWSKYSKAKSEQLKANAEYVAQEIKWRDWDAIAAPK